MSLDRSSPVTAGLLRFALLAALAFTPSCSEKKDAPSGVPSSGGSIHQAAAKGDVAQVTRLLAAGTGPETSDGTEDESTPIHVAAKGGHAHVVALLLQKGANANARNKYLMTPLHYAAVYGHASVAELLLSSGAEADAENHGGWTPLFNASMEGQTAVMSLLLSKGADVAHADADGNTALHYAAGNGEQGSCSTLLDAGAPVNAANNIGETPLTWLKQRARWSPAKHKACAALLIKHGAK